MTSISHPIHLSNQEAFLKKLNELTNAKTLCINKKGELTPAFFFNRFKGEKEAHRRLVELKVMELLFRGKQWLMPKDLELIKKLAGKAGLVYGKKSSFENHRELRFFTSLVAKEMFHGESIPLNDYAKLSQEFQRRHFTILAPFSHHCENINQLLNESASATPSNKPSDTTSANRNEEQVSELNKDLSEHTDLLVNAVVHKDPEVIPPPVFNQPFNNHPRLENKNLIIPEKRGKIENRPHKSANGSSFRNHQSTITKVALVALAACVAAAAVYYTYPSSLSSLNLWPITSPDDLTPTSAPTEVPLTSQGPIINHAVGDPKCDFIKFPHEVSDPTKGSEASVVDYWHDRAVVPFSVPLNPKSVLHQLKPIVKGHHFWSSPATAHQVKVNDIFSGTYISKNMLENIQKMLTPQLHVQLRFPPYIIDVPKPSVQSGLIIQEPATQEAQEMRPDPCLIVQAKNNAANLQTRILADEGSVNGRATETQSNRIWISGTIVASVALLMFKAIGKIKGYCDASQDFSSSSLYEAPDSRSATDQQIAKLDSILEGLNEEDETKNMTPKTPTRPQRHSRNDKKHGVVSPDQKQRRAGWIVKSQGTKSENIKNLLVELGYTVNDFIDLRTILIIAKNKIYFHLYSSNSDLDTDTLEKYKKLGDLVIARGHTETPPKYYTSLFNRMTDEWKVLVGQLDKRPEDRLQPLQAPKEPLKCVHNKPRVNELVSHSPSVPGSTSSYPTVVLTTTLDGKLIMDKDLLEKIKAIKQEIKQKKTFPQSLITSDTLGHASPALSTVITSPGNDSVGSTMSRSNFGDLFIDNESTSVTKDLINLDSKVILDKKIIDSLSQFKDQIKLKDQIKPQINYSAELLVINRFIKQFLNDSKQIKENTILHDYIELGRLIIERVCLIFPRRHSAVFNKHLIEFTQLENIYLETEYRYLEMEYRYLKRIEDEKATLSSVSSSETVPHTVIPTRYSDNINYQLQVLPVSRQLNFNSSPQTPKSKNPF